MVQPAHSLETTTTQSTSLEVAYAECERLAGRDKPHLYAAASLFERPQVRRAFVATYASMRLIDDLIDGISNRSSISVGRQAFEMGRVQSWLELVRAAKVGDVSAGMTWTALADTFAHFDLPLDPWANLAIAMQTDVMVSSFKTWDELRGYMQGASVAPAVIFMYLVLMRPDAHGKFGTSWNYTQVYEATEDLAIFCYCVHILRDVAEDLTLGVSGLVYLPEEELSRFGIGVADLHAMRESGMATDDYRQMACSMADRARQHLGCGRKRMPAVLRDAEPSNGKALMTLIDTYERILNDLQDREFDVFSTTAGR